MAVHTGYLPEYDYDLETHRHWFTPKVQPLDLAKVAKRNLRHAKLGINTGINEGNIREATKNGTADKQEHPGLFNKKGHIGFLGHGSPVQFRNIRIKELKD